MQRFKIWQVAADRMAIRLRRFEIRQSSGTGTRDPPRSRTSIVARRRPQILMDVVESSSSTSLAGDGDRRRSLQR
ncbi:hypothetical protein TIFTF001_033953 [Ficus carica]|uniref:Uncharacterized protein n=1 Tax=Ficus carica TaxID=3494 RepID=A0AA88DZ09_FICCA|nr:hypothetical protein TIFTF001_033953 [Ficus carica]